MNRKPNLEACSRGGKKHKPNLEGCAKGGRKGGKAKWEKELARAKVAEATAKAPQTISGQTKLIVQNPSIPWKGVF